MVKGKRVLVTGASTGIGEQMAYHYAHMGAKVFITARTESKLQKVIAHCREIGDANGEYHYLPADMADVSSYEAVIKVCRSKCIKQEQCHNFSVYICSFSFNMIFHVNQVFIHTTVTVYETRLADSASYNTFVIVMFRQYSS